MTTTITRYQSAQPAGRDGFGQLLRAEWTKFRTVRGWLIAVLAVIALTAAAPVWLAATASGKSVESCGNGRQCQAEGQTIAVGPAGTAVIDTFYFVHQPLTGNGSITVRVTSLRGSQKPLLPPGAGPAPQTQPWAKAGIIIKASTRPGSAYAAVMVTGSHGVQLDYNYTHDIAGSDTTATAASPQWLRLTRHGNTVTGSESANGRQWTAIGTATLTGFPVTAQAGMFVASPDFTEAVGTGDSSIGGPTQASAAFDHLSLRGGSAGPAWTGTQVGSGSDLRTQTPGPHGSIKIGPGRSQPAHGFTARAGSFVLRGSGDIAPFEAIVDPLHVVFFGTLFGLIVVIALGAMFITAEYRRALIRTTVTASPRRGRILVAKAIVVGAVTFVAALIGAAIAFPLAEHKLDAAGWKPPVWPQYALTSGTGLQVVLGTAAIAAGAAILGLAAGAAFRRSAGAVMTVIGIVILPVVLAILLPLSTGSWLLRITPAAAFSLQQTVQRYPQVSNVCAPYHECFPLSPWHGFAVLCGWAAIALAGAIYLLRRRDI
ncbi:MAG TPA: ABC transporter permease subunit [Streptosporangiaceae bacterium]|jgi:hypothetical protein|nr:ABC transporter permease subunit [Streptosporangiaceae bacterium]